MSNYAHRTIMSTHRLTFATAFFFIICPKHIYVCLSDVDCFRTTYRPHSNMIQAYKQNKPRLHSYPPPITHFNHTLVQLVHLGFVYPPHHDLRKRVAKMIVITEQRTWETMKYWINIIHRDTYLEQHTLSNYNDQHWG